MRTPPGGCVEALWPEVRRQLAVIDPALELVRAAAPEERRPAAGGELAVEEDREAELLADAAASFSAAARARGMSSGSIGTSGTTSAAPIRGCAPS